MQLQPDELPYCSPVGSPACTPDWSQIAAAYVLRNDPARILSAPQRDGDTDSDCPHDTLWAVTDPRLAQHHLGLLHTSGMETRQLPPRAQHASTVGTSLKEVNDSHALDPEQSGSVRVKQEASPALSSFSTSLRGDDITDTAAKGDYNHSARRTHRQDEGKQSHVDSGAQPYHDLTHNDFAADHLAPLHFQLQKTAGKALQHMARQKMSKGAGRRSSRRGGGTQHARRVRTAEPLQITIEDWGDEWDIRDLDKNNTSPTKDTAYCTGGPEPDVPVWEDIDPFTTAIRCSRLRGARFVIPSLKSGTRRTLQMIACSAECLKTGLGEPWAIKLGLTWPNVHALCDDRRHLNTLTACGIGKWPTKCRPCDREDETAGRSLSTARTAGD